MASRLWETGGGFAIRRLENRMRAAILAFLLLVVMAGTADARELSQRERAVAEQVAESAFPAPTCSDVDIIWTHQIVPVEGDEKSRALLAAGYTLRGYSYGLYDGTCKIAILSDLSPPQACTVAVHERGHLIGLEHNNGMPLMGDENGMILDDYVWPDCNRATAYLSRAAAIQQMIERVSDRTRVSCARQTLTRFRCVTHRRKKRKVFVVVLEPSGIRVAKVAR